MNKYKLLILIMFIFCVTTISKVNAKIKNYSLLGRCIYLDAGHGGVDSGAISNNFLEKDMNLLLVEKLANELFYRGAMVFLTRDGDYDLANNLANVREEKKENGYYMYSKLKIPGILIEAGYISNSHDNYIIRKEDYQNKLVKNIANGINDYLNS